MTEEPKHSKDTHDYHDIGAGHIAIIVAITTVLVVAITSAVIGYAMFA